MNKLSIKKFVNSDISSVCRVLIEESQKSAIPEIGNSILLQNVINDHTEYLDSLARSRKSEITQEARKADARRDEAFVGLMLSLDALTYSPNQLKRSKAEQLINRLEKYTGIQNLPDTQETTAISRLLIDLKTTENATLVIDLGLQEYVDEISAANAEFDRQWNLREGDITSFRNSIAATKLRTKVEESINHYYDWVVYNAKYSQVEGWSQLQKEIYSRYLTIRQKYL